MKLNNIALNLAKRLKENKLGNFYILEGHYTKENFLHFIEHLFSNLDQKIKKEFFSQDYLILEKDSKDKEIKVSSNEFQTFMKFNELKPIKLNRKLVFIYDANELGVIIYNKILKTLEENDHTTFILFKDQYTSLMPTILSRAIVLRHHENENFRESFSEETIITLSKKEFSSEEIYKNKNNYAELSLLLEDLKEDQVYESYHSNFQSRMSKILP